MGKQPVLAYSVAGVAVAIAIAVVSATTLGLAGATGGEDAPVQFISSSASVPFESIESIEQPGTVATGDGAVEYVYVDEPQAGYDEDEDDEHERVHDGDDDHDDEDDHHEQSRGDHDDDDD